MSEVAENGERLRVAVTGATGFVGGMIVDRLRAAGMSVVQLSRHRPQMPDGDLWRQFELGRSVDRTDLEGVDALVHCAYDFTPTAPDAIYQRNVVGTTRLFNTAAAAGVGRLVLISSMSAYTGTSQIYGRAKLECERFTEEMGGLALRLGLVWGDDAGGMAGTVERLAALPIVPVIGYRSHQFTVHARDVALAVEHGVTNHALTGTIGVAHPDPVPTPTLFRTLAQRGGRNPGRMVPAPWRLLYAAMRAAELARLPLPLRADSVLGLVRPAPAVPRVDEWASVGLRLRALTAPSK